MWLAYVKERIDQDRDRAGQYLLTGSQNLLLAETVTESLAGRAAMLRLLPLSRREAANRPQAPLPWEPEGGEAEVASASIRDLWASFLRGQYPWWPSPGGTRPCGIRLTSRPTWSGTSGAFGRWGTSVSTKSS